MAEYIGFALDIGAYFVFSHLETRLKENVFEITENLPSFQSHADLKQALRLRKNGEVAYARLDGQMQPDGQPLYTDRDDVTAVHRVTDEYRVRRSRCGDGNDWRTEVERQLGSKEETVPFNLVLKKDMPHLNDKTLQRLKLSGKLVEVGDSNHLHNLGREAKPFHSFFTADNQCLTAYEISKLQHRTGIKTSERILKTGSPVSIIGRVKYDETRKEISVVAPPPAFRYILTSDVDTVVQGMEEEAHRLNLGRRAAIVAGVVFFYIAYDRLWRDLKAWLKRKRN